MATFDQLSDEQRAIVELVLRQGKRYDELSDMLDMPEARVRELARDALVDLAPISARGVEEDWRGQIADYVLGQQAGPEATATRGHLRRSEAARSWTRSLLDSLEQLYPNGDTPAIPEGERGARRAAAARRDSGTAAGGPGAALGQRGLLAAAGAALLVVLLVVLVWPVGVLTGDEDDGGGGGSAQPSAQAGDEAPIDTETQGSAVIGRQQGKTQMLVTATGLEPTTERTGYQVWLYNSERDRKSLGAAATNAQGQLQAGAELPADYRDYRFIDLTSVTVRGSGQSQRFETGPSVLRGVLELSDRPVSQGQGKNRITVLAQIRLSPLPASGG
jgi:Sigma-70, region 4